VRVPPGPVLPSDRQLGLDAFVVRAQVLVADRPVGADAVIGQGGEVRGMEAGGVAGVVDHRAADAAAGVVLAQFDRVVAADDALLGPVQLVGTGLVGDPVLVGVPERPGLEDDDLPAVPGQPLREHRAAGPGADDDQVDLLARRVATHRVLARQLARVHVEQEPRIVVGRADRALEQAT